MRIRVRTAVIPVIAVRPAAPAEPLAMPRVPVMHPVTVLAGRTRPASAQQAERGDDRVERIRVLGIVRHAPILHAT
ncbi:hypothetical protein RS86_00784 [Microbacterium azadirachtae]|uniref:Uncharacterized protein n=1 Tax=Microbacterium azadirachtae TaxID=582680 RepID=A0A0F0LPB1_9MICO|nr:hypothetical protein RS86_00784 [Microbacterium azadirachtae]